MAGAVQLTLIRSSPKLYTVGGVAREMGAERERERRNTVGKGR